MAALDPLANFKISLSDLLAFSEDREEIQAKYQDLFECKEIKIDSTPLIGRVDLFIRDCEASLKTKKTENPEAFGALAEKIRCFVDSDKSYASCIKELDLELTRMDHLEERAKLYGIPLYASLAVQMEAIFSLEKGDVQKILREDFFVQKSGTWQVMINLQKAKEANSFFGADGRLNAELFHFSFDQVTKEAVKEAVEGLKSARYPLEPFSKQSSTDIYKVETDKALLILKPADGETGMPYVSLPLLRQETRVVDAFQQIYSANKADCEKLATQIFNDKQKDFLGLLDAYDTSVKERTANTEEPKKNLINFIKKYAKDELLKKCIQDRTLPIAAHPGIAPGESFRRDCAYFAIAELLGFQGLVPYTEVVELPGALGPLGIYQNPKILCSIQTFVEGCERVSSLKLDDQFFAQKVAVLAMLTANSDLNLDNFSISSKKTIDGGVCLPNDKQYEMASAFLPKFVANNKAPLEKEIKNAIKNMPSALIIAFCDQLKIEAPAIDLLKNRLKTLQNAVLEAEASDEEMNLQDLLFALTPD